MRARRVAIMLVLTAITALTLFIIVLLEGTAEAAEVPAAQPDTLVAYSEVVSVDTEGDATVSVTVVVGRVSSMDLLLPWNFEGGRDHQIVRGPARFGAGPDGDGAPLVDVLGRPHWNLSLTAEAAPGDTVVLTATAPGWYDHEGSRRQFGAHALARSWINTSRFVMRGFALGLELPPGLLVDAVGPTTPSFNPNRSPRPPYTIGRSGDRGTFTIGAELLPPAGRVALAIEARPVKRGPVPLAVGLVCAGLYLALFRDVLKPAAGR